MVKNIFWFQTDMVAYRRKDFELEVFIAEIEDLPTLWEKLEKFNEYYDLIQRRNTGIFVKGQPVEFMLECSTCEGQRKNGCVSHNENNAKKVWQFIYEKAQEDAQNFKLMPYEERVEAFYERFGESEVKSMRLQRKWGKEEESINDIPIEPTEKAIISIEPNNEQVKRI